MANEGQPADQAIKTFDDDRVNVSKLSAMNPSELFRLAAELGLTIRAVPSSSGQDLRLTRYVE
jgi:hypothetical protein